MKRRDFLRKSAAAAVISMPYLIPGGVLSAPGRPGANDRVVVGLIGPGHRARGLIRDASKRLQVVALADCDLGVMDGFSRWASDARPDVVASKMSRYQDYRQLLEREKLDGVIVATTTHARVLICVHAMQAGLDVYAEKPLTLTIEEGWHLIKAERKYKRIFQTGTQQRSIPINNFGSDLVRSGAFGKIHTVLAMNFIGPELRPHTAGQAVPEGMNWDMWCNQTKLVPYSPDLHPGLGKWGRWRAYDGGGLGYGMTGWGAHAFDQVQRALGTDDTTPVEVWPEEPGPLGKVSMRYANGTVLKLNQPRDMKKAPGLGAIFIGEKGRIAIERNQLKTDRPELIRDAPKPDDRSAVASVALRHLDNWMDCVRSRKRPQADATIGHRSTVICHLINISRELGRKLSWDPVKEEFIGDDEANKLRSRPRRKGYALPETV